MEIKNHEVGLTHESRVLFSRIGKGRIKVISTSKIKKITAIRKNRKENVKRLGVKSKNPHSKGDGFSRSRGDFFASDELMKIKIKESERDREKSRNIKSA